MWKKITVTVSCCLVLCLGLACYLQAATIQSFSPKGTVKQVRQATARFSDPMVAFGDPRLADPFEVKCSEKGAGRWIDDKRWSYDFERDLPAGAVCTFTLKPGLKTLSGQPVMGETKFTFDTGGPSVIESRPYEGDEFIDENQRFLFVLDGEPDGRTIAGNVYCTVEGIRERIDVRVITGKEKEDLLKDLRSKETRPQVLLECRRTFPPKSVVKVVWGKGVKSKSGIATRQDQVLPFKTREPFTARFNCTKEKANAGCMPLSSMTLGFTAPVPWEKAQEITLRSEKGRVWKPGKLEDGEGNVSLLVTPQKTFALKKIDAERTVQFVTFEGPFPENTSFTVRLPEDLRDDAGRPLTNAGKFPLQVKTDGYPPLARFASTFGIIEAGTEPLLPVTVRNIETEIKTWMQTPSDISQKVNGTVKQIPADEEKVIEWLKRLRRTDRRESIFKGTGQPTYFSLPKPGPSQEFEVIGIPLKSPGFYVVELESLLLGSRLLSKPAPMYVPASALVTNMTAHFKWGRRSSLVWVTSLDKAEPVRDAGVTLRDCTGRVIWQGKTDADGLAKIEQALPSKEALTRCRSEKREDEEHWMDMEQSRLLAGIQSGLFVFARKGADMTFTHSSWDTGIEPWRFNLPTRWSGEGDPYVAHTVFDRTLVRAGETVHMKHFVRKGDMMQGLLVPPERDLPREVTVQHAGSDQKYTFPVRWSGNGTAETAWQIPRNAKLGTYAVYLPRQGEKKGEGRGQSLGSFRVEEFRVPLMRAMVKAPKEAVVKPKEVELSLSLAFLSGGGASLAPVRLRSEVRDRTVSFPDYEEFTFSNGHARKGLIKPAHGDEETEFEDGAPVVERSEGRDRAMKLKSLDLTLDRTGAAKASISDMPSIDRPSELVNELEFRDPNGEVQTVSARTAVYPAKMQLGIAGGKAASLENGLSYKVLATDLAGKPLPGVAVEITLLRKNTYSHRRRLTGGFYAFEHVAEVVEMARYPAGKTGSQGMLFWEGSAPGEGQIIIQAEARDDEGNLIACHYEDYVYGKGDQWFEAGNDDRIDLIPEKKTYEPGETARFQVRMPFREATILLSVEREGVMETHVRKVSRRHPVVELPVKEFFAPNVYVAALAVRGRTAESAPTATFDAAKPAYKLGIAEIKVGWQRHELKVRVETPRKVYRVRETVDVKIAVKTAAGQAPGKGSEVTVAAVDEGLLELRENESWKLLEAMMKRRPYEVESSTAQMMVVGKRHFGRKALPHGGGGGKQVTRELFDTLLLWKGTVPLDEKGEARVSIPLNDSLTSFRIVAVAAAGQSLFGTGMTAVSSTQELMILPGLPPLVREGDRFTAGFTLRNTTAKPMEVHTSLATTSGKERKEYAPIVETLAAGQSKEIGWDLAIPAGSETMAYELKAVDKQENRSDTIKVNQKVVPVLPVTTYQGTLSRLKEPVRIPVERPRDAIKGRGGVQVLLRASIGDSLTGVRAFMNSYPYLCFEQRVSKAVALRDESMWKKLMDELPSYMDGDGLVKYFPVNFIRGSDVLTSYVLSIAHEAGYKIPAALQGRIMAGLKGFVEGRIVRWSSLPTADLALRKLAAVEALSRYREATPAFLNSITIEPNLWPTSTVLDWINILTRVTAIPDRQGKLDRAQQILRSRINTQGTTMNFSTEKNDYCWWLMASPDANAVRAVLTAVQSNGWDKESPALARGAMGRLRKGHWNTTVANAWGVLAMEKFSRKFESVPVRGTTAARLDTSTNTTDWAASARGSETLFPWPEAKQSLSLRHQGTGSPWLTVQSLAAVPLKQPLSTGYAIRKTILPVEQKARGKWSRGDVQRIRLEVDAQSDMTWVVVDDPIPTGATILGSALGRDSASLAAAEGQKGWAFEAFRERSFEGLRVYFEYVRKGKFTVEYTVRLNNQGRFNLPPTRVEALYSPEMLGMIPNRQVEVLP